MGQSHAILLKEKSTECVWALPPLGFQIVRSVLDIMCECYSVSTVFSHCSIHYGQNHACGITSLISVLTFHCLLSFLQVSRKRWQGRKAHIFLEWMHAPLSGVSCKVWRQRLVGAMNVVVQLLLVG